VELESRLYAAGVRSSPASLGFAALVLGAGACASPPAPWLVGGEVQAYPAGVITALHAQREASEHGAWTLRAGYNVTDRDDYGEHDDEHGGGPGVGVGYRYALAPRAEDGWLVGARADLWYLDIDWKDNPGDSGSTDVLVLQPTVEAGYGWWFAAGRLELTVAAGAEINVHEDGEDVGQGAIGLIGVTYLFGR